MVWRRGPVMPFGRGYRRPPRKPSGLIVRLLRRILNPFFYLRAVILVAAFGLFVLPSGIDMASGALHPVTRAEGDCRIVAVLDGDTVTMACPDLGVFRARLLGLDAPEKYSPSCAEELVKAEAATWALRGLLLQSDKQTVSVDGVDRYGRRLVRLAIDGEDVAARMIRNGHARRYGGGLRGSWC